MKKKGFTLIELLAVIVILVILALIAIPIILNIIEKARKNSYKISSGNIVKTAELYYNEKRIDNTLSIDGNLFDIIKMRINGTKPRSGEVFISNSGKVAVALKYGDFCYSKSFQEEQVKEEKNGECLVNHLGKDVSIKYINIVDSTGLQRNAFYGDELVIDFNQTQAVPKALQITMDGKIISELVHYEYNNGILNIPRITGNIEINNIEGYCVKNGINNLADCLIVTDTLNNNIELSKTEIRNKLVDLNKIEPQIDYGEVAKVEISGDNLRQTSTAISCSSEKPHFNNKTGRYTFSASDLVELPNCISTENSPKYTCMNIDSTGNCTTIYSIKDYSTEIIDNVTTYKVTKEERYASEVLKESISKPGLYTTTDNYGETYYFRGTAINNYINFAGFIWRIVRINGDGSIRLIYSGTSSNDTKEATSIGSSAFNLGGRDPALTGYKYGLNQTYKETASNIITYDGIDAGTSYYFADNYTCNNTTKTCRLSGNFIEGKWLDKYNDVIGGKKYTCFASTKDSTCSIIIEVLDVITSNGNVNPRQAQAKYHGYLSQDYESTYTDEYDSEIKKVIDNWYDNNLKNNYEQYLSDNIFCSDRTIITDNLNDLNASTFYSTYQRNVNTKTANLRCQRYEDQFTKENGKLINPIGLITADEMSFAGGVVGLDNQKYYLNSGIYYWTMSPSFFHIESLMAFNFFVTETGNLNQWPWVGSVTSIRPVINLKADTQILGGDGTKASPYIIMSN